MCVLSFPRILHRGDPEPAHAPRLCARGDGIFDSLEAKGVTQLAAIESVHVATYIEQLSRARSGPTAKLRLAALLHLFDWMVIGQIMPTNAAAAVRGPRHIVRRGKTPALDPAEARQLIDAIDTTTVIDLRDRALIGLMVYSFARIGAAIGMRVEDVYTQNRRLGAADAHATLRLSARSDAGPHGSECPMTGPAFAVAAIPPTKVIEAKGEVREVVMTVQSLPFIPPAPTVHPKNLPVWRLSGT